MEVIEFNCNSKNKQDILDLIYFFRFCGFCIHEKNIDISDNEKLFFIKSLQKCFEKDDQIKLFSYVEDEYIAKIYIYNKIEEYSKHKIKDKNKEIIIILENYDTKYNVSENIINYSDFPDDRKKLVEKIINIMYSKNLISINLKREMGILNNFYFENNVYPLLASSQRLFINENKAINDHILKIYNDNLEKFKMLLKENVDKFGQLSTIHIQNAFIYFISEISEFKNKYQNLKDDKLVLGLADSIFKENGLNLYYMLSYVEERNIKLPCLYNIAYYAIRNETNLYLVLGLNIPKLLTSYYNQYFLMDVVKKSLTLNIKIAPDNVYYFYPMALKLPKLFPDDYNSWLTGLTILYENIKYAEEKNYKRFDIEKYEKCFELYINMTIKLMNNQSNVFNMKYINDRYKLYNYLLFYSHLVENGNDYLSWLISDELEFFERVVDTEIISEPVIYVDNDYDIKSLKLNYIMKIDKFSKKLLYDIKNKTEEMYEKVFYSDLEKTKILQKMI